MPNPRSILQTFALKAVLLWMICHSSLCLAENATVTGVVNYRGVIPGPTYVWALEANGTKAAESILPDGNGTYALSLLKGRGYDFKVFVDGSQNGYPTTGEVWKHYTDWNNSLGGYNLTQIDGNISGIDFSLLDQDSDNDGFLNWHEFKAGTQDNNASSTPPLNFGLIAHWTFDETNGTVLHDSTANEINGTMHGFTNPWNPGREGGAFRFDGINDYISFPGANQLDDLGPFSFSGWVKLDHNGSGYVIAKRSLGTGYWRYFASGPTKNWLTRKTTGNAPSLSTTSVTPFFQWQHVALTWTGLLNAQNSKMYLDGTLLANVTRASGAGDLISDVGNLFTLGNRPQNNSSYFKGWMDDFRIWNRVITPTEVHSIYNASPESNTTISGTVTHTGTVPGSVIIWVFDESGTKLGSQTLTNGPGSYSFTLPVGHSYDIKAFRDGNGNGQLDPSIGEPYAHWGSWNGSGFDRLPVNGNKTGVDIAITWEADTDSDGFTLWQETQAGTQDNNVSSKPNSAPIDLNSTTVLSIAENQSVGTLVGEFNATDHDLNASLTYKLVSGEGDTDNSLFRINPIGKLRTAAIFDYENNASTYSIRVRVKDEHNATLEKKFTIALLNGNDGPVIHLGNGGAHAGALWAEIQVFENTLLAHEINATDQDGDVLSFTKTAGADKALFSLNSDTGTLSFKAAPDFENPQDVDGNNTYEVWFRVIDGKGRFDEKRLTVRVTDVLDGQNESNKPSLAVISGKVNYTGDLSGSTYVRAYDSNWTKVAEAVLPSGSGNYSLNLTTGQSYDLRAFVDADGNGTLNFYIEPVQVYGDWNTTLQEYMRIPVDGNLTGIDFTLVGLDTDGDGFENFHEYMANTSMVEANSTPGFDFGLVGHWKLKETNGTNAKDSSALRNDGMIKTDFNSSSVYVEVPHNKAYLSDEGTVSFWVKIKNFGVDAKQGFFSKDAKGFGSGGHLSIYEQNGTLTVRTQSTHTSYILDHNESMVVGEWTHVAFTWGRSGMELYQNGSLVESAPYGGGFGLTSGGIGNSESIILGAGSWNRDIVTGHVIEGFLNGRLRAVRLYNRKIKWNERDALRLIGRKIANEAPNGIDLNGTSISENSPVGSIIGDLKAFDSDQNASFHFSLFDQNGTNDNHLFEIQANRFIKSKSIFDFESNRSYSIVVEVRDEFEGSFLKSFTINVLNEVEDLDNDGLEDHIDLDDDGDGFGDELEITYGSDPRNLNSVANRSPTGLDLNGVSVLENRSVGTLVGQLIGHDPDGNATLTFSRTQGPGSIHNNLFQVGSAGKLTTKKRFDFEANATLKIRLRVKDEHNASFEKAFVITVLNDPSDDLDDQNGTIGEPTYPLDGNGTDEVLNPLIDQNQTIVKPKDGEPDQNGTIGEPTYPLDGNGTDEVLNPLIDQNQTIVKPKDGEPDQNGTIGEPTYPMDGNGTGEVSNPLVDQNQTIEKPKDGEPDQNGTIGEPTYPMDGNRTDEVSNPLIDQNQTIVKPKDGEPNQNGTIGEPTYPMDGNGTGEVLNPLVDQNQTIVKPNTPVYVPMVRTLFFDLDENETHRFGGRVLTDGGSEILEVGILISQSIRFSEKIRLTAALKSGDKQFRIKYKKLEGGTRYYYRAYARNKEGETLGSIRKLMTIEKIDPSAWWAGMPEVGGSWRRSDWLGAFRTYEGIAWIYHAQLGWSYVVSDQNDGIWIWQSGQGWMWSQNGVWPFLYSHRKGNWLYFTKSVGGRPIFYDYGSEDYWIDP